MSVKALLDRVHHAARWLRPAASRVAALGQKFVVRFAWFCFLGESASSGGGCQLRGLDLCGQATKGTWGMSWRQKAMKGVEDCEKPGGIVKQVMIPGFPN